MLSIAFAVLQIASTPADIELRANFVARSMSIERQGRTGIQVTGNGRNVVDIEAPKIGGRKQIANPSASLRVEVRIADPAQTPVTTAADQAP